jgi:hypothetical protein
MSTRKHAPLIEATLGYAADDAGIGVAYASIETPSHAAPALLRVPFRVRRYAGLAGREIGYAAVTAVAAALRDRKVRRVRFAVQDEDLVHDLRERRALPQPLTLPYIRLGCSFNQFSECVVVARENEDLTGRARAEVALHVAA